MARSTRQETYALISALNSTFLSLQLQSLMSPLNRGVLCQIRPGIALNAIPAIDSAMTAVASQPSQ
jgi:hypothetical protein